MTGAAGARLDLAGAPRSLDDLAEVLRHRGLPVELHGAGDVRVSGITADSRSVQPGDLFMAWAGTAVDAHRFVGDARARGAVAALVERDERRDAEGTGWARLVVGSGRRAAALVAMAARPEPAVPLHVTAVTGTNGKTTTVALLRQLLAPLGPSAALGTLGLIGADGHVAEGTEGLTTPGPVELALRVSELEAAGVRYLTLEASSHALDQDRLAGLEVDVAVFTNLGRDHLDYHPGLQAYREAKEGLAGQLVPGGVLVVNADDPAWRTLEAPKGCTRITVGVADEDSTPTTDEGESGGHRDLDLRALGVVLGGAGSHFLLAEGASTHSVNLPLPGRFNVENALVAVAAARAAGRPLEALAKELSEVRPPPGRMEVIGTSPCTVIRDYAHTPDALARVLETLRPLTAGRLVVVFGAGGDRDRAKRPLMGREVVARADVAVVTSDNPRTEDPGGIVDEILEGVRGRGGTCRVLAVVERREAIRQALELGRPGDTILLAGKGHEVVQVVGTEVVPFDEQAIVAELSGGRP